MFNRYGNGLRGRKLAGRLANAQRALELYLNPRLARRILADPGLLSRGGQRREMTIFFSDLVGFTSLAEYLSPEDLVGALNHYFEVMEPLITRHGGLLDKFGGDSIMAFWGAPLWPARNHAASAALAALDQQAALFRLNQDLIREGRPPLSALMGLNTGPVVVGNIGAEKRLNYTVMGDAVNLAARLVAVNKIYHTQIILSGRTALEAAEAVELRTLDRITVPGRQKDVTIHEVLAPKGELDSARREGRDLFEAGLEYYWRRDFQKALGLFEEVLGLVFGDGPSELMGARCREFLLAPPPEDWPGVTELEVK